MKRTQLANQTTFHSFRGVHGGIFVQVFAATTHEAKEKIAEHFGRGAHHISLTEKDGAPLRLHRSAKRNRR